MARKHKARLNEHNNPLSPTESVLAGFEQVSNSATQPSSTLTSSETEYLEKTTSPQKNLPTSSLRKATFKINSEILDSLDRYHLQLQLDLGKRYAPFKEIIVELALQQILEQAQNNPQQLLQLLLKQQQCRS